MEKWLPASSEHLCAGPPLLVLVAGTDLLQPVEGWLKEELQSTLSSSLGPTKVVAAERSSLSAMQDAAEKALKWLAENSRAQPWLQVCLLPNSHAFSSNDRVFSMSNPSREVLRSHRTGKLPAPLN